MPKEEVHCSSWSLSELQWGDQWSVMEKLDGKLIKTLVFVMFALAVFALMCNMLPEFYDCIKA